MMFFFFNDTATTEIYTLSLHDALPISTIARSTSSPVRSRKRRKTASGCYSMRTRPNGRRRTGWSACSRRGRRGGGRGGAAAGQGGERRCRGPPPPPGRALFVQARSFPQHADLFEI